MDVKEALKDVEMKILKAIWEVPKGTGITLGEFKIKHKDLFDEAEKLKQMLREE